MGKEDLEIILSDLEDFAAANMTVAITAMHQIKKEGCVSRGTLDLVKTTGRTVRELTAKARQEGASGKKAASVMRKGFNRGK